MDLIDNNPFMANENTVTSEEYLKNMRASLAAISQNLDLPHYERNSNLDKVFRQKWRQPNYLEYVKSPAEQRQILLEHNEDSPPILNMRNLYRLTYRCNQRYAQWVGRALTAAIRAGAISGESETRWLMSEEPKNIKFLHVKYAMILLRYGPNALHNRKLVEQLSRYTAVPIPPLTRARAELHFAIQLRKLIEDIDSCYSRLSFELKEQQQIERYRVDFVLNILEREKLIETYILEFDEAYHQTTRQLRKDKKRDAHLLELGYKIIRVNESEAKKWLEISSWLNYPFHRASVISDCINDAIKVHPRTQKRYISTESALASVNSAVETEIIDHTKQTLNQMAKLLDMQKIPYLRTKMLENGKEKRVLRLEN